MASKNEIKSEQNRKQSVSFLDFVRFWSWKAHSSQGFVRHKTWSQSRPGPETSGEIQFTRMKLERPWPLQMKDGLGEARFLVSCCIWLLQKSRPSRDTDVRKIRLDIRQPEAFFCLFCFQACRETVPRTDKERPRTNCVCSELLRCTFVVCYVTCGDHSSKVRCHASLLGFQHRMSVE